MKQLVVASVLVAGAFAAVPTQQASAGEGGCSWVDWIANPVGCFLRHV